MSDKSVPSPFPPWPSFTQEESDAVSRVLLSNKVNYWTGEEGREFEREFATFAGTKYAIALANGTLALDLALHGLGIGAHYGGSSDDEVIVTSRSFMASVSTVVNAGARPIFADVNRESQNIDGETVAAVISPNTRAVICVHLAGWPCDMDAIRAACDASKHGKKIKLIEDCAQAHGAKYKGMPVGGLGDVAAWSFCQDKIMTTGGEGGMVTLNDTSLWKKMWAYKDHGKSWDAVYERDHPPGFRWLHESFGTNWRLTEMQSAIGRIQLKRMPEWQAKRAEHAQALNDAITPFAGHNGPVRLPRYACDGCGAEQSDNSGGCNRGCTHARYKYYFFVRPENLSKDWSRDRIAAEISALGVPCIQGSCSEIYRERAFDDTGLRPETPLPVAVELGENSLMLMVHPTITTEQMDACCDVIAGVLKQASK